MPSLMSSKERNSKPHFKFYFMQTKDQDPIDERAEIVQDVIDRLLYLTPEQVAEYKESLEAIHSKFQVSVQKVNGLRIYSATKNQ